MPMSRRTLLAAAATTALPALPARAEKPTLKIGVLTDLSGPYKDAAGPGAVDAARLAVEESGLKAKGIEVEIISGDHRTRPMSAPAWRASGSTGPAWT